MKLASFIFKVLLLGFCCNQEINAADDNGKTVQIGFAAPLAEGPGRSARDAALLAIGEINSRAPNIAGQKIFFKLLDQDDKADVNIAVLTARYFVASQVLAVIGHWNSAASVATAKIYGDAGIIQISPSATSTEYTQQGLTSSFRMVGHDGIRSNHIGAYALTALHAQRIMVVDDGTLFGIAIAEQFTGYVKANLGEIVGRASISNKTSDFAPVLKMVSQLKPDLIFHGGRLFSGSLNHSETFIGGLKRLGFPKNIILSDVTVDPDAMRDAALGNIAIFAIAPGIPPEKLPRWKSFHAKFAARSGSRITPYTLSAYDAVYALVEAMKQADSLDFKKITSALHGVKYAGLTGTISFDAKGDLINPGYTLYQAKQGDWVPVRILGK